MIDITTPRRRSHPRTSTASSADTSWRRRAVLAGIGVVLLVGIGLQVDALLLHRRADRASAAAETARGHETEVSDQLEQARTEIAAASVQASAAATALDQVRAALVAAGTSEAVVQADVAAARSAMSVLQGQVDAAAATVATKTTQFDALRACLTTGQRALDDAAAHGPGSPDLAAAATTCSASAASARTP